MSCDPNFSGVVLLLHCDGTNGSTVFPDSSNISNVMTAHGAAAVTTTNPEYGTGSLGGIPGVGTGNSLTTPITGSGPLDLSTGDFTIECSVLLSAGLNSFGLVNTGYSFGAGISLDIENNVFSNQLAVRFGTNTILYNTGPLTTGVWVPVAFVRQGNNFGLWANGVAVLAHTQSGSIGTGASLTIGGTSTGSSNSGTPQIDEVRITALARYTPGINYTPATSAFGGSCAITVPNVTGDLLATGESVLTGVGLVIGSVTQTSDPIINSGFIISTSPVGGTGAMVGDTVDISESNSETAPNVVGELLATGESNITGAGFAVGTVTATSDPVINAGYIISTTPAGGTRATAGSNIDIVQSNSETVPPVTNTPQGAAEAAIVAAGLTVGTETTQFSLTVPGGYVISASPTDGVRVTVGAAVALLISSGPGSGTVPNVLNLAAVLAEAAIVAAGFVVGTVTTQPDAIVIAGNVDAQSPAGGDTAFLLSPVDIIISSGLPDLLVPDLFELSQTDAITLLLSLGLTVGAIGSAPSKFVPPGTVQTQNPSAGTPVAAGSVVSFVLSLGTPAVGTLFDFEATVISQYANSPTILQLVNNLNEYIDQSANFANFFNYVWNVDTAVGFGLDIWGKIVGVSRLLHIPTTIDYVGFDNSATPPPDWQTMGSDQPPQPAVGGAMYTGYNATQAYLLGDDAYRQLILAKAFANICATTAPAINQILQNLYGPGTAWVLNTGVMSISYNLTFTPTAIQLAILEQSGVIPTPPGVSVVINTGV